MRIIVLNSLLAIGITISILGILIKILHYVFWGLNGNSIFFIGLIICGLSLALHIFSKKR